MTPEQHLLHQCKNQIKDNLYTLRGRLNRCVELGLIDNHAHFYNELLDLEGAVAEAASIDALSLVVMDAKQIESDIDTYFAGHGQSTYSLEWGDPF